MDWLPPPSDFRNNLRAAIALQGADRLDKLAALAQQRLGFLETIQLGRAISQLVDQNSDFSCARIAILASSTVDHLVPAITVAGVRRRLLLDVQVAPYGQYRQALLDPASALYEARPHFILLSLTARELITALPVTATSDEVEAAVRRAVDELRALWRTARESLGAVVIQQTFLNVAEPLFGSYDRLVAAAPDQLIRRLNDRLAEAAVTDGVLILDVARASEREGLHQWFDAARWLQGKMGIAPQIAPMYGELVARVIAAQRGLSKKCLVLDLDNTLWGGVVGDDGPEGIVLGEGSAVGEAHLALQRYAKQLADRGVVIAVCSKNDPSVAEAVFREHPEMLLKLSDIAAFVANWEDKTFNLLQIAERLNLGVESLVFVDDNPVERARVRESLPMVAVPELPDDVAQYVRCLADAGYFEAVAFTSDDAQRGQQYAANVSRDAFRDSSQSLEGFLEGLDMTVVFGPFQTVDLQRITQLIGKTNQFNLTNRRYPFQDVAAVAAMEECLTLQFRLIDRFGDNGLVCTMILRPDPADSHVLDIDTWVMSCRVFGRQLELETMNIAVEAARRRGVRALRGHYVPTSRNGVVKELYATLGFLHIPDPGSADKSSRWCVDLTNYVAPATFIARQTAQ